MGGSGGGSGSGNGGSWSYSDFTQSLRREEERLGSSSFSTAINAGFGELLRDFNSRDAGLVQERLQEIKDLLSGELECAVDSLFGGSVAKKTYIEGLSDIDSLILIDDASISDQKPSELLELLSLYLKGEVEAESVKHGKLAVTIRYSDGMEIQILPAFKKGDKFEIPSFTDDDWATINPQKFYEKLTKVNTACSGKVVPVIKLAKGLLAALPASLQLSGYHIEALAIDAFKNYSSNFDPYSMLDHFFKHSQIAIKSPIKDSTGQSVHVDEYLGEANSPLRIQASRHLEVISKRFKNALSLQDPEVILELFEK